MLTNNFPVVLLISNVLIAINFQQRVESAPIEVRHYDDFNHYPIVYRRYIRRRPPIYLHDQYMEDIIEIFDTKEKPPAYGALMTDADVYKFIYCDFNRDSNMCNQYWANRNPGTKPIVEPSSANTTPKPAATTSASKLETTTEISGIPHLDETEYIYSDEIQQVENNQDENNDNYEEEIDY